MSKSYYLSACALIILSSLSADSQTHFNSTTTLAAETANNTSAADSLVAQPNGNIKPGNVSKVPISTLLYRGSTAKVYAHFMPWFGFGNHINVGYVSNDERQVQKQVKDMISRGLDGLIIDWYGPGVGKGEFLAYDQTSQEVMHEAESHPGFAFALMHDAGTFRDCVNSSDCDVTHILIQDLNYAERTYEHSSAYLRYKGRPVVFFFGDDAYQIDWRRVRSQVAGNPLFVFRNSAGFTHPEAEGAFSWVSPLKDRSDHEQSHNQNSHNQNSHNQSSDKQSSDKQTPQIQMGLDYLDNFYRTAVAHHDSYAVGTGYKGFNDSIALWDADRIIDQHCGQTWLKSIADINNQFSLENQIPAIQLVTWNDYEEGTEFESGVDNCVTVSDSVKNTSISWRVKGDISTVDHFTIFVSEDGENLMPLANVAAGETSLDLAHFGLDPGNYLVFVKAVGKPSLTNTITAGRPMTVPPSSAIGPAATLSVASVPISSNSGPSGNESSSSPAGLENVTAVLTSLDGRPLPPNSTIDFGDGTISVGATIASHTYKLAGTYTILVTTTDANGTSSSFTNQITVVGNGVPNFK